MRDPERIGRIISKLQLVWEHYPDWRLGQLIENAGDPPPRSGVPLFHIDDDDMEEGFDRLIDRLGK